MIAAALAEQAAEFGIEVDVPDDLAPVDVWACCAHYRSAFLILSAARRQNGFGWEALSYSDVVAYAERNGFAGSIDELEEFVRFIQEQDSAFLQESATTAAPK